MDIKDQNTDIYEALLPPGPAMDPKRLETTTDTVVELIRNGEFTYSLVDWVDTSEVPASAVWVGGAARLTGSNPI